MESLRVIRKRIKSVENTRQITESMKMVASAKLRRTQTAMGAQRDFARRCEEMLARVLPGAGETSLPLLRGRDRREKVCFVLILGNRGLCGSYNQALLRYAREQILRESRECFVITCGRWGKDLLGGLGAPVRRSYDELGDTPDAAQALALAEDLRQLYLRGEADEVLLLYQQYRSVLQQEPGSVPLLPATLEPSEGTEAAGMPWLFEPDREALLEKLLTLTVDSRVYAALLEARTGEHSARMTAMTAAADNSQELIGELTLALNHARQSAITTEISEIAGGAEALRRDRDEA